MDSAETKQNIQKQASKELAVKEREMKAFIYDCYDEQGEITLKDKPIDKIIVIEISGDEHFVVIYSDGEQEDFDATEYTEALRTMSFFDGIYIVPNDEIAEWAQMEKQEREEKYGK